MADYAASPLVIADQEYRMEEFLQLTHNQATLTAAPTGRTVRTENVGESPVPAILWACAWEADAHGHIRVFPKLHDRFKDRLIVSQTVGRRVVAGQRQEDCIIVGIKTLILLFMRTLLLDDDDTAIRMQY
jgi:hypothetical protein